VRVRVRVWWSRSIRSRWADTSVTLVRRYSSAGQEGLCRLQVGGLSPFLESSTDLPEQSARIRGAPESVPASAQAERGAQLETVGVLLPGDLQGRFQTRDSVGVRWRIGGSPALQQQLNAQPGPLRLDTAFFLAG